jgi:apolipoprotein N-acyltransferase
MDERAGPLVANDARAPAPVAPLDPPVARRLGAGAAYGLAFGAGILYWMAFPGVDLWPLALVAWVPLLVAMQGQTARRAALLGWLAGVTLNFTGFFWLQKMLVTFSGLPRVVCLLLVLLVCAYQGGRMALLGWLHARATARGWHPGVALLAAFAASELGYPVLFPWYFGATVHSFPLLMQVADLGGPILVGAVLVAANVAVGLPILAAWQGRRLDRRSVVAFALVPAAACAYGAYRIRAVDAAAQTAPAATVGIVQANMGLVEKRTAFDEGLRRHLRLSEELKELGVDFLVWSETSVMRAVGDDSYRLELRDVSRRLGLPAVFGSVIARPVAGPRRYVLFNSAVSSDADGIIESRYDKRDLLAFGEYLPLGETFPVLYSWSPNSGRFSPGQSLEPLQLRVHGETRLATTLICYEDILPREVNRAVARANPELLVNLTNDAWFLDTAAPWEHFALAQMRAVEHHRYFVRGTNTGVSAVVDPVGRVVTVSGTFREQALSATIRWLRASTLYERLGDGPWAAVTLLIVVASLLPGNPTRARCP